MPFVVGDEEPEGLTETEMEEWDEVEGDADATQIFGRRMPEDIVHGVTGPVEIKQHFLQVFLWFDGEHRLCRLHLVNATVGARYDLLIGPITQPAAAKLIRRLVGRQGD